MFYNFPTITHIDDVLPAIEGCNDFVVSYKDEYTVINYMVAKEDTFDGPHAAIRRECRGLKFDQFGKLIGRPYHKFWNMNEKDETHNVDFSQPHVIMEKLDGSMIHPTILPRYLGSDSLRLILNTKMGETDVAKQVYPFIDANLNYKDFMESFTFRGYTPIFEWCSRKQRIVVDHPVDRLVLTAIRDNLTGKYMSYRQMVLDAKDYGIDVVRAWNPSEYDWNQALSSIDAEGGEGIVIRFDNGHMLKVKTDTYLQLHRVKSSIEQERNVIALILDEKADDLRPLLSDIDLARLNKFEKDMVTGLEIACDDVLKQLKIAFGADPKVQHSDMFDAGVVMTRKEFALDVVPKLHPTVRNIAFKFYGVVPELQVVFEAVQDRLRDCLTSNKKLDENRYLIGDANWKGVSLDD
jgi:RNA ligase